MNQQSLQQRLKTLIEGQRENWTYAIFWQSSIDNYGSTLLGWGDGYYKGEEDKSKRIITTFSVAEQVHRKKVFGELNSLISGVTTSSANNNDDHPLDDDITDPEWFFLLSMTQSFINGGGLPGRAFYSSLPIWVAGKDRLLSSSCDRGKQGQMLGLQTMVFIPVGNGVVELGSTELIFHLESWNNYMVNNLRVLFNFNGQPGNIESSLQGQIEQGGENVPFSSASEVIKVKDYRVIDTSAESSSSTDPNAKTSSSGGGGAVHSNQTRLKASVRRLYVDSKIGLPKNSPKNR